MSSNKTIIPGMETAFGKGGPQPAGSPVPPPFPQQDGTYVPDAFQTPWVEPVYKQAPQKPIVGFLYSISRSNAGEFWPLRIGPNTIGRSPECDVRLEEGTVSGAHATLVVRMMKNPERVIASVCDSQSTIGTMINGESLGFEQKECVNGDIITIGAHYDLLFILIDAKQIGLKVCPDFISAESQSEKMAPSMGGVNLTKPIPANPYAPPIGNRPKRTRGLEDKDNPPMPGTVGLTENGAAPSSDEGSDKPRTIFM